MNNYLKIAHRGYSVLKKYENTIFSFQKAIKKNFDMIELAVHLCKSNDIIIYHDDYIKHNQKFTYIKDLTYEEINEINPFIITLPFLFKNIDKNDIKIYIDIKGDDNIIEPLIEFLDKRFDNFDNLLLASFNRNCLKKIIDYNKTIEKENKKYFKKGFITENIFTNVELLILLKDIECIIIHWTMLNKDLIDYCKKNNKDVYCYTLKDLNQLEHISKFDIDGIVSDIIV